MMEKRKTRVVNCPLLSIILLISVCFPLWAESAENAGQSKQMVQQLFSRNKELDEQNQAYQKKMLSYISELTEKDKEIEGLGKKLAGSMEELQKLRSAQEKAAKELSVLQSLEKDASAAEEMVDLLSDELDKTKQDLDSERKKNKEVEQQQEVLKTDTKGLTEERDELAEKLKAASLKQESLSQQIQSLEKERLELQKTAEDKERLVQELKALEAQKAALEAAVTDRNQLAAKVSTLESEKASAETEKARLSAKESELEKANEEIRTASEERDQLAEKLKSLEQEKESLSKAAAEAGRLVDELEALKKEKINLEDTRKKAEAEKAELLQKSEKLEREKSESESKIQALQSRLKNLEASQADSEKGALKEAGNNAQLKRELEEVLQDKARLVQEQSAEKAKISELTKKLEGMEAERVRLKGALSKIEEKPVTVSAGEKLKPQKTSEPKTEGNALRKSAVPQKSVDAAKKMEGEEIRIDKTVKQIGGDRVSAWQNPGLPELNDSPVDANTLTDYAENQKLSASEQLMLKSIRQQSAELILENDALRRKVDIKEQEILKIQTALKARMDRRDKERQELMEKLSLRQQMVESLEAGAVENQRVRKVHEKSKAETRQENPEVVRLKKQAEGYRQRMRRDRETYFYNLGVYAMIQGRFKESAEFFEKAVRLDPKDASAHYNLGIIYDDHMDRPKKAIHHYQTFLRLSRDTDKIRSVAKWMQILQDYGGRGRQGRVQNARDAFEKFFLTSSYN